MIKSGSEIKIFIDNFISKEYTNDQIKGSNWHVRVCDVVSTMIDSSVSQ